MSPVEPTAEVIPLRPPRVPCQTCGIPIPAAAQHCAECLRWHAIAASVAATSALLAGKR
jgi:hypothetical protein